MSRYDDIDHLLQDLEAERRYKDSIEVENMDLEKMIVELEGYLRHLDEVAVRGSAEDNEWKVRYEIQKSLDAHLSDHKAWLEAELAEMEWKYHTGSYPEAMNCNVDLLTELELIRLVKHMDRVKNDYYNTVRDTEYKTEKETKEFHHFDEMRRTYKSDIKHHSQNMERMRMEEILDRQAACTPPLFSPSYVRWLDSQSLDEVSHGLKKSSKSHRSKSLSKEGRRSTSKSPSRSKSRNEKSASRKKDESEDPEPTTTTTGTEAEGATSQSEDKGSSPGEDGKKDGGGGDGEEEGK